MALCHRQGGRFLYEALPDIFPPLMTETETDLWARFYEEIKPPDNPQG